MVREGKETRTAKNVAPFLGLNALRFPSCVKVLISFCCRDLNEDPRIIRKRVEKDRATDKDWVTFKQNPARFTQVGWHQLRGSICNFPYCINFNFELYTLLNLLHGHKKIIIIIRIKIIASATRA